MAVLAAGAHSRRLAQPLGDRLPLETERGCNLVLDAPGAMPRGVVQLRVTRETWNPLVGAALATFGVTHKPPVLNHSSGR